MGGKIEGCTKKDLRVLDCTCPLLRSVRVSHCTCPLKNTSWGRHSRRKTVEKKFVVAYVSQQLLDAETRYGFIEKLCLSLYYACVKFRHYILSSTCIVVSRHDVVKYML
jgi:hypothetical protein